MVYHDTHSASTSTPTDDRESSLEHLLSQLVERRQTHLYTAAIDGLSEARRADACRAAAHLERAIGRTTRALLEVRGQLRLGLPSVTPDAGDGCNGGSRG